MTKLTSAVAVLLTIAFLIASGWLLMSFGLTGEHAWDHAVVIYNALTSVGFTAIGVLLGTKVQQVNIEKANSDVGKVTADAQKKSDAIHAALSHLDNAPPAAPPKPGDDSGGGLTTITAAKLILRQALS